MPAEAQRNEKDEEAEDEYESEEDSEPGQHE
jgi:hypothetical protein